MRRPTSTFAQLLPLAATSAAFDELKDAIAKADTVEQYKELLEKGVEDMMEVGQPGTFFFLGMKSDMQMKVENIILAQAECTLLRGFGSGQEEMRRVQASDVSTSSIKPSQTTSLEKPCVRNYELRVQTHLVSLVLLTHQKPSRKPFPTSTLTQLLPCCNQCNKSYLEGRAQCYLLVEESKVDTDELRWT